MSILNQRRAVPELNKISPENLIIMLQGSTTSGLGSAESRENARENAFLVASLAPFSRVTWALRLEHEKELISTKQK